MNISRDQWLQALDAAVEPNDPNVMTRSEIAALLGVTPRSAGERIRKMLAAGSLLRTSKVMDRGANGRVRVPAYRLASKAK